MTARTWVQLILRPPKGFAVLKVQGGEAVGFGAALATGILWSLFIFVLALRGHQPSGPLVIPIPRDQYYVWETIFATPVYLVMFLVSSTVIQLGSRIFGTTKPWRDARLVAGHSLAVSSIGGWLIPDVLVYSAFGFEALGWVVKVCAPLSFVWGTALAGFGICVVHGLGRWRAWLLAFLAGLFSSAAGAPFLR